MSQAAVHIDGDRLQVPFSARSHAGFRRWVKSDLENERARLTFHSGELFIEMSPESVESHNKVKGAIYVALARLVAEYDIGELYGDGVLLTNDAAELSTEPDVAFASWETLESGALKLEPKSNRSDDYVELVGSPDLVVEVVSDSSVRKDTDVLRRAYAQAGIHEYWLVDARGGAPQLTVLALDGDAFAESKRSDAAYSVVLARSLQLTRHRNRAGRWSYALLLG